MRPNECDEPIGRRSGAKTWKCLPSSRWHYQRRGTFKRFHVNICLVRIHSLIPRFSGILWRITPPAANGYNDRGTELALDLIYWIPESSHATSHHSTSVSARQPLGSNPDGAEQVRPGGMDRTAGTKIHPWNPERSRRGRALQPLARNAHSPGALGARADVYQVWANPQHSARRDRCRAG